MVLLCMTLIAFVLIIVCHGLSPHFIGYAKAVALQMHMYAWDGLMANLWPHLKALR